MRARVKFLVYAGPIQILQWGCFTRIFNSAGHTFYTITTNCFSWMLCSLCRTQHSLCVVFFFFFFYMKLMGPVYYPSVLSTLRHLYNLWSIKTNIQYITQLIGLAGFLTEVMLTTCGCTWAEHNKQPHNSQGQGKNDSDCYECLIQYRGQLLRKEGEEVAEIFSTLNAVANWLL